MFLINTSWNLLDCGQSLTNTHHWLSVFPNELIKSTSWSFMLMWRSGLVVHRLLFSFCAIHDALWDTLVAPYSVNHSDRTTPSIVIWSHKPAASSFSSSHFLLLLPFESLMLAENPPFLSFHRCSRPGVRLKKRGTARYFTISRWFLVFFSCLYSRVTHPL